MIVILDVIAPVIVAALVNGNHIVELIDTVSESITLAADESGR